MVLHSSGSLADHLGRSKEKYQHWALPETVLNTSGWDPSIDGLKTSLGDPDMLPGLRNTGLDALQDLFQGFCLHLKTLGPPRLHSSVLGGEQRLRWGWQEQQGTSLVAVAREWRLILLPPGPDPPGNGKVLPPRLLPMRCLQQVPGRHPLHRGLLQPGVLCHRLPQVSPPLGVWCGTGLRDFPLLSSSPSSLFQKLCS